MLKFQKLIFGLNLSIHLLTANLSFASKNIWRHHLNSDFENQIFHVHVESSTLNRQGEDNRIQLNSASIEILVHMIDHKELSIDSVTKSLWNGNNGNAFANKPAAAASAPSVLESLMFATNNGCDCIKVATELLKFTESETFK